MKRFKLIATITGKSLPRPIIHEFYYRGEDIGSVVACIDTLPFHQHNLKLHRKTAFKDVHGLKHTWVLKEVNDEPINAA